MDGGIMNFSRSEKRIPCLWQGPFGLEKMTVVLPELTERKYSMGGDWGTEVRFQLEPKDNIEVIYHHANEELTSNIEMRELIFKSPMHADLRDKYPLVLALDDKNSKFKLELYFNEIGHVLDSKVTYCPLNY